MDVFDTGSDVTATLSFELSPVSSASYSLFNELGQLLLGPVPLAVGTTDTEASITIPGANNSLPANQNRGVRVVVLAIANSQQSAKVRYRYILQRDVPFVVPQESFVTLDEAFMYTSDFIKLDGWNAATDTARRAALSQAHESIDSFCFNHIYDRYTMCDFNIVFGVSDGSIGRLSRLTYDSFIRLPDHLIDAVKKAQLVEANDLLGGSSDATKQRQEGIQKIVVGESQITFRTEPYRRGVLCQAAMDLIRRYVRTGVAVVRA